MARPAPIGILESKAEIWSVWVVGRYGTRVPGVRVTMPARAFSMSRVTGVGGRVPTRWPVRPKMVGLSVKTVKMRKISYSVPLVGTRMLSESRRIAIFSSWVLALRKRTAGWVVSVIPEGTSVGGGVP